MRGGVQGYRARSYRYKNYLPAVTSSVLILVGTVEVKSTYARQPTYVFVQPVESETSINLSPTCVMHRGSFA